MKQMHQNAQSLAANLRAIIENYPGGVGWPLEEWWCYNAGYTLLEAGRDYDPQAEVNMTAPESDARCATTAPMSPAVASASTTASR